ncbi:SCP2 sterol-binding domain-containing protein [Streptomyces sp. NPDC001401]|uniref:SCP2 sterol-binding domain-containing protein n=1 Tax=Streptomyces sp. NPDC001401 TaxID=3364570 RepID=UPI0036BFCF09
MTAEPAFSPQRLAQLRFASLTEVRAALALLAREDLAAWLATPDGEDMLRAVFAQMPARYIGGLTGPAQTARWQVRREGAATVVYDLILAEDVCEVREPGSAGEPALTLTLDAVGFVEMASAAAQGMDLLLEGRLHISGDVQLAMRMELLFGLAAPGAPQ